MSREHNADATITVEEQERTGTEAHVYTLRLRPQRMVRWEEGTVDNEYLGRKKSKKCCIFHKRRNFDESDSSDSDGSGSSGEEEEGKNTGDHKKCRHCHDNHQDKEKQQKT